MTTETTAAPAEPQAVPGTAAGTAAAWRGVASESVDEVSAPLEALLAV